MQTAWSRSLRPQNPCRCISCISVVRGTLTRRTTTGIARKRLNAADAFGLLLGPVLGSAFIVDAKAKDKRRREWDEKIAAVKAEVELMQQREIQACSIRSRNLRRLPALTRCYSSVAATSLAVADDERPIRGIEDASLHVPCCHNQDSADTPAGGSKYSEPIHRSSDAQTVSNLSETMFEKCRRLQRLVTIKLAIRMLLHIHIGKSPRYVDTTSDYVYEQGRLPQDANDLIRHLKRVGNSLKLMNSDELRLSWRAYQSLTRGKTCRLDEDMSDLARRFRRGEMNVSELIVRFAEKLLSSSESPTVRGYIPLLCALSRARFDELGFMIDGTMIEARLPYDRHAVFVLLWQYGKNKEAQYFDKLIKKLTTDSANAQFGEQWLWRDICGTLVPLPPSQDPQILQILVYAALKCNQPHRAEAWSTILASTRAGHMWFSHVTRNFLKYYAAHRDWRKGMVWMKTALSRAEAVAAQGIRHLQRITFAMLDFCVAYGERALYRDILEAAADCRLGVYTSDPDLTLTQRTRDILTEWELCHERRVLNSNSDIIPSVEKARLFKRKLQHIYEIEPEARVSDLYSPPALTSKQLAGIPSGDNDSAESSRELATSRDMPHNGVSHASDIPGDESDARHWRELCRKQQIQLDSLKRQLDFLKSEQTSDFSSMRDEIDRSPLDAIDDVRQSRNSDSSNAAAPQPTAERVRYPGKRHLTPEANLAWRPLPLLPSGTSNMITDRPLSGTFSQPFLQYVDQPKLTPRPSASQAQKNPSNPASSPHHVQDDPRTIAGEEAPVPVPARPVSSKVTPTMRYHAPTTTEIDRMLEFCSYVVNCLASHIKAFPVIQPLHRLVSTVPRELLIQISLDGVFVHLVRQTLTQHERDVFWHNLTVEVRERKQATMASLLEEQQHGMEVEAGKPPARHCIDQQERTWRGSPRRDATSLLQESGRKLEATKLGRGALRFQVGPGEKWLAVL